MRILFILHTPPPVHGSSIVGQYIKDSKIINKSFDCRYVNLGTSTSIDEIGKKPWEKISRYLSILSQVFIEVFKFKPGLCYFAITVKGLGFYKDALVALLVKTFGIKLVFHFHNKGVSMRQNKWFDNLLYRIVFKNSEVILLSEYLYPDIQKYVPKGRIHFCPNGIPEQIITINQEKDVGNSTVEILFLSNLIEAKGVYVLLEACKLLQKKELHFHCTYVGGEGNISVQQLNQKINELGLNNTLHYAGMRFGNEKVEVFSSADIFVHPTLNDCFPLVLLEAMQFSLPIISTFEGGIPDIIDDELTGLLVPKQNAIALADKLELLIRNKNLREMMGKKGRLRYEQHFTLEHFEDNLNRILNNCLLK